MLPHVGFSHTLTAPHTPFTCPSQMQFHFRAFAPAISGMHAKKCIPIHSNH